MDSTTSAGKSLRSASTLLFCRLCQSVYKQPKLLPCLHSFCKPCLADAVMDGGDGPTITCPLCSYKTRLTTTGGAADLPDNCFLSRMCQEYITEVQSHILARSSFSMPGKGSSEFAALRSKLTAELPHSNFPQSSTDRSQHADQENDPSTKEMSLPYSTKASSEGESDQPAANSMESIHNMGMLQNKIMNLQGEALRVTYAIDYVNQCATEWNQHKEDVKRAVQRRGAQFQFFIKRMEHQLLAHIDDKQVDDEFYASSDKSKNELRKVLRNILHEVSVLKSIQEFGQETEINTLSQNLLGKSVGMAEVMLKKFHYEMEVPTESIEEMVGTFFGEVHLYPEESTVFSPQLTDFNEVPLGNFTQQPSEEDLSSSEKDISILEDEAQGVATDGTSSTRSFSDSSYIKYTADPSLDDHTKQHLAQFQTARETLRTRRREILVRGQKAREGVSSLMDEFQAHPRSAMRKSRVQSLDRTAVTMAKRTSKRGLVVRSNVHANLDTTSTHSDTKSQGLSQRALDIHHVPTHTSPHGSEPSHYGSEPRHYGSEPSHDGSEPRHYGSEPSHYGSEPSHYGSEPSHYSHRSLTENINIPSPLTEEVCVQSTVHRKLVKQTSDPHVSAGEAGSDLCWPTHSQSVMENLNRQLLDPSGSNLFPQRRHSSDHYIPPSNGEDEVLDLLHNKTFTRPVRRAISSVANKKQRMEILRENWQKRKEILIQNEGFVSPEPVARHSPKPTSHDQFLITSGNLSIAAAENILSETETNAHASYERSYQGEESYHENELTTALQFTPDKSSETKYGITNSTETGLTANKYSPRYQTENRTDITIPGKGTKSINLESINQNQPRLYEVKSGDTVNRRHSSDVVTPPKDMQTMNQEPTSAEPHAKGQILATSMNDFRETPPDHGATPEPDAGLLPSCTSPQPPPSPTTDDSLQKLKLREIARKKKERWRHLTIH